MVALWFHCIYSSLYVIVLRCGKLLYTFDSTSCWETQCNNYALTRSVFKNRVWEENSWDSLCYCALLFSLLLTHMSYHILKTTLVFVNQAGSTWNQCYSFVKNELAVALLVYVSTPLRHYKGQNYSALNAIECVVSFMWVFYVKSFTEKANIRLTQLSEQNW